MGLRLDVSWADLVQRLAAAGWRSVAGLVAVVVTIVGGCLALRSDERAAAIVLPRAAPAPELVATASGEVRGTAAAAEIVVHAAGAVRRPGVYRLAPSARVVDLLEEAGGPGDGADLGGINLAAPLADGARVHFPTHGEDPPAELNIVEAPPEQSGAGDAPRDLIDLNSAGAAELEALPGIGPVIAAAIISHREQEGPFASVESLQEVTGIGPVKLSRIADLVTAAQ